jgi:hypothetical protein
MLATPAVVDAVVKVKGDYEWRLMLEVDRAEWTLPRAVFLLEEKLNSYASFALDGMMQKLYPHSHPQDVHIVVASVDPLPEKAVWLLEKVKIGLRPHSIKLSWDPQGGAPVGGTPPPAGPQPS